jgi:hypothetical protein
MTDTVRPAERLSPRTRELSAALAPFILTGLGGLLTSPILRTAADLEEHPQHEDSNADDETENQQNNENCDVPNMHRFDLTSL